MNGLMADMVSLTDAAVLLVNALKIYMGMLEMLRDACVKLRVESVMEKNSQDL